MLRGITRSESARPACRRPWWGIWQYKNHQIPFLSPFAFGNVLNKGEQMVRYYGYYSNVSRGRRKKAGQDGLVPSILQPEESSKGYRKNW